MRASLGSRSLVAVLLLRLHDSIVGGGVVCSTTSYDRSSSM